ncbi:hypothetical protein [Streptomyces sp. NEAU-NA10]|uniref:hypothetical protein n=1 Tax=Streptomyces sp. NEAU-NA10 TaxID=3416050 RepID=UPI003CC5B9C0
MTTVTRSMAAGPTYITCGCGEDRIPGFLAQLGVFGTTILVLGLLTVMIMTGWLLAVLVWAVTRWWRWWQGDGAAARQDTPPAEEGRDEAADPGAEDSFFGGFGRWREDGPG